MAPPSVAVRPLLAQVVVIEKDDVTAFVAQFVDQLLSPNDIDTVR